jgi:hypothetical protein
MKHRPIKEAQIKRMIEDAQRDVAAELAALDGSEEVAIVVDDPRTWGPCADPTEDAARKQMISDANGKPIVGTFPLAEALEMVPASGEAPEVVARPGRIPIIYIHGFTYTVAYAVLFS